MTTLEFNRGDSKYEMDSNGKARLTVKNGPVQEGKWTATSSKEVNEITIDVGGNKKSFPVVYSFDRSADNYNALKVKVPAEGTSPEASAIFDGTIELDDEKDITYRLPEGGGSFVIYGKLSFGSAYDTIQVELKDNSKTSIECSKPTIQQGMPGTPDKSTYLTVTTYSQVGKNGKKNMARIGVFGNLVPKKDGIVFMGSADGKKFDITIAGTGKLVNGALQISSTDGKVAFAGAVRYVFKEGNGSWGVMFGYSDKEFSLGADLTFKDPAPDGRTKLSGKTALKYGGGKLEVSVELEGQFLIGKDRALQFSLKAGFVNGKKSVYFSGKVEVNDQTITAVINYQGSELSVKLAYESEYAKAVIEFLRDGNNKIGFRFYVEYTIGAGGRQHASKPTKPTG